MIIKTIFVITIFSNIENYTDAYNLQLLDNLLNLKMDFVDEFNNKCQHAAFLYIVNRLYEHDTGHEDQNNCISFFNKFRNADRFKTKRDRISEVKKLIFRLQRLFDHGQVSPEWSEFYKKVWKFIRHFTSFANDDITWCDEKNEVNSMASDIIEFAIGKNIWSELNLDQSGTILNTYYNCITTFDSLPIPTTSIEDKLLKLYMEDEPNYYDVNDKYLQKMFLSPLQIYGNILPLLNTDQSDTFLALEPRDQKIFIVDIMCRALVNAFDVMNTYFDKLKISNFTMEDIENIRNKSIREMNDNNNDHVMLKIFMILYEDAISTVEAIHNIPDPIVFRDHDYEVIYRVTRMNISIRVEIRFEAIKEFDDNYSFFTKKCHAKWTKICSDTNSYIHDEIKKIFKANVKNKYEGQLTKNNHIIGYSIRISMYEYYSAFLNNKPEIIRKEYESFLTENRDIKLLLDIRLWMMIIRKTALIMINDIYLHKIGVEDGRYFMPKTDMGFEAKEDYMLKIKEKIKEREKTQNFIDQQNIFKNDKRLMDHRLKFTDLRYVYARGGG